MESTGRCLVTQDTSSDIDIDESLNDKLYIFVVENNNA
jgi:hypothetical protein